MPPNTKSISINIKLSISHQSAMLLYRKQWAWLKIMTIQTTVIWDISSTISILGVPAWLYTSIIL